METLEILTRRIGSTEDLQSLVRSMKTLSAVGMRQLEQAEASLGRFRHTIDLGLQIILRQHAPRLGPGARGAGAQALVVIGSDRGLCGSFNDTVAELAHRHVERERPDRPSIHVMAVGGLAALRLGNRGIVPDEVLPLAGSVQGLGEACERILIRLDSLLQQQDVQHVATIFNRRNDAGEIVPSAHVLLPLGLDHLRALERAPWPSRRLPTFSIAPEMLFSWLVRQHLLADINHAMLSSMVAENAARLAAMQRAGRNIDDKLQEMTAEFRRLRQDAITTELMDIVGGYEVLRTKP